MDSATNPEKNKRRYETSADERLDLLNYADEQLVAIIDGARVARDEWYAKYGRRVPETRYALAFRRQQRLARQAAQAASPPASPLAPAGQGAAAPPTNPHRVTSSFGYLSAGKRQGIIDRLPDDAIMGPDAVPVSLPTEHILSERCTRLKRRVGTKQPHVAGIRLARLRCTRRMRRVQR